MSTSNTPLSSLGGIEASHSSSTPTPTIVTPSSGSSSPRSGLPSPRDSPLRANLAKSRASPPPSRKASPRAQQLSVALVAPADRGPAGGLAADYDSDEEAAMGETKPPLHRPTDGPSQTPLLKDERGRPSYDGPNGSARPAFAKKRSTFQSRSPDMEDSSATRKKYVYAAFFLALSLVSFTVQTETAVYIQHELKWNKAYAMLWVSPLCALPCWATLT